MASTFSPNLRIELIGAGEQSGAWNNTTNTNLGTLIEQAISGVESITLGGGNYTLEAANGAEDQARNMVLIINPDTASRNIIAPDVDKVYIVRNTDTVYAHTIKTSSGSGVSIPANSSALVFCDATGNGTFYNAVEDLAAGASIAGVEIVTVSGSQTLTNKTLTAPKFADGGFIADANGNEIVVLDTVTSAVNEITVANAATGAGPSISASGSDSNIDLLLVAKGTGVVKAGGVEVITLTGTQNLTNKTITNGTVTGGTVNPTTLQIGGVSTNDLYQPNGKLTGQTATASSSYTLALTDAGKIIEITNSSANTITVPLNSSAAFPLNTVITLVSGGTGQTTISPAVGVTINSYGSKRKLSGQWSMATLIKKSTDTWWLAGDLMG